MKLSMKAGTTQKRIRVLIINSSTSLPMTGLTYNTAGLTFDYIREDQSAGTSVTFVSGTVGTWLSNSFAEITSVPGFYELGLPDAALASGQSVQMILSGATNMGLVPIEIELTATDNQNAANGGLSALPAVAAGANNGLPLGNSSGQVSLNLVQAVPTSNTAHTLGDALNAARAQGFGPWRIVGTAWNLYASDGTTLVKSFTLDSASSPTSRS
jgi:hypothetical protein